MNSAMQNRQSHAKTSHQQKKMWLPGIEPGSSAPKPRYTSRLNYGCFLYEMHPQPYLIGIDREKYLLINHSW
jgi:hypothetical protein